MKSAWKKNSLETKTLEDDSANAGTGRADVKLEWRRG